MSLPSQTGRFTTSGRSNHNMYRRRRGAPKPLLIAGGLSLVVVLGLWLLLRGSGTEGKSPQQVASETGSSSLLGPQSAAASPAPAAAKPPVQQPQPTRREVLPEPPPQPVLELRQGRPATTDTQTRPTATASSSPAAATPTTTPTAAPDRSTSNPPASTNPAITGTTPDSSQPAATPPQPDLGAATPPGSALAAARQKQATGDLVAARVLYSRALRESRVESERAAIRAELTKINDELVFSRRVAPDDPWAFWYTVQANDALARINQRQGLAPDWRLIQRINGMSNPNRLQVGQKLKLLRGPFHAVVSKSAFRLDLYMGPADREDQWLYIRSFPVGLGEGGSTPLGTFVVRRNSKLINPHWVNPRTGQHFAADDPLNPIGERWIGLEGIEDSAGYVGYGLHGTIDPGSIGREMSMGCVRMHDQDIELIYELLGEQVSVVRIEP